MNGVMGMIDIAKRRMADPKGQDQLDKAKRSAERLLGVLNDILDLSKIEADRLVLEHAPFKPSQLLEQLMGLVGHKIQEKGLKLRVDLPAGLSTLALLGDPLRLRQVLINLVGNALKFTQPDVPTRIRIRTEERGAMIRVWVEDNGIGIEPQYQEKIFDVFTRLHGPHYGGTGIGLAIVRQAIVRMGGSSGVESDLGQGSRFWFELKKGGKTS
jgi:signal transduction histidine kinase